MYVSSISMHMPGCASEEKVRPLPDPARSFGSAVDAMSCKGLQERSDTPATTLVLDLLRGRARPACDARLNVTVSVSSSSLVPKLARSRPPRGSVTAGGDLGRRGVRVNIEGRQACCGHTHMVIYVCIPRGVPSHS